MAIHELLIQSEEIKTLVYARAKASELREVAIDQGMIMLKQDGMQKMLTGLTDMKAIRRVCMQ